MAGLDHMLSKLVYANLTKKLGANEAKKIEARLFEKFGITLIESVEQFDRLDKILREFFGQAADSLEKEILENVCRVEILKKKNHYWVTIDDAELDRIILESYGGFYKKKILDIVNENPKTIYEIIKSCNIPQTSGYRLINSLVEDGLLVIDGFIIKDKKKVNKYKSVFQTLKVNIQTDKIIVDLLLNKQQFESSLILTAVVGNQ